MEVTVVAIKREYDKCIVLNGDVNAPQTPLLSTKGDAHAQRLFEQIALSSEHCCDDSQISPNSDRGTAINDAHVTS